MWRQVRRDDSDRANVGFDVRARARGARVSESDAAGVLRDVVFASDARTPTPRAAPTSKGTPRALTMDVLGDADERRARGRERRGTRRRARRARHFGRVAGRTSRKRRIEDGRGRRRRARRGRHERRRRGDGKANANGTRDDAWGNGVHRPRDSRWGTIETRCTSGAGTRARSSDEERRVRDAARAAETTGRHARLWGRSAHAACAPRTSTERENDKE